MIGGRVLDSSAVLDVGTGKTEYARALFSVAAEIGVTLVVPAAALQSAWSEVPPEGRAWLDLLSSAPIVVVDELTAEVAREAGIMSHLAPGVAPGTVQAVHSARTRGWPVVTADPASIHALDPSIKTEVLP